MLIANKLKYPRAYISLEEMRKMSKNEKTQKIHVKVTDVGIFVYGNTYAIKDQLKNLGFTWDPLAQEWVLDHSRIRARNIDVKRVVEELKKMGANISAYDETVEKAIETLAELKDMVKVEIASLSITVVGNTFPIKDLLKGLGFTWNPSSKRWTLDYVTVGARGIDVREVVEELKKLQNAVIIVEKNKTLDEVIERLTEASIPYRGLRKARYS